MTRHSKQADRQGHSKNFLFPNKAAAVSAFGANEVIGTNKAKQRQISSEPDYGQWAHMA